MSSSSGVQRNSGPTPIAAPPVDADPPVSVDDQRRRAIAQRLGHPSVGVEPSSRGRHLEPELTVATKAPEDELRAPLAPPPACSGATRRRCHTAPVPLRPGRRVSTRLPGRMPGSSRNVTHDKGSKPRVMYSVLSLLTRRRGAKPRVRLALVKRCVTWSVERSDHRVTVVKVVVRWVVSRHRVPRQSLRRCWSRPAVGSSRSKISGSPSNALARTMRRNLLLVASEGQ